MFGLTQIIKSPARIICSSTSLIDHIFASLPDRIAPEGVINVGLSDHQLNYGTRKTEVDAYENTLRKINFPNYEYFEDANQAYLDFFQKLMTVIDNVAPCKTKRVKGNTQNWFDAEVLEKLRSRDKLFKMFTKTRLHFDKELYKKAKYDAQKLIAAKKQVFFDEKLSESVGKPKELWNSLKSLGSISASRRTCNQKSKWIYSICTFTLPNNAQYALILHNHVELIWFYNVTCSFLKKIGCNMVIFTNIF